MGPGDSYFISRGMVHWAYGIDSNDPLTLAGIYVGGGSLEETGYEFVERLERKALFFTPAKGLLNVME